MKTIRNAMLALLLLPCLAFAQVATGRQVISNVGGLPLTPTGATGSGKLADHVSGWINVRSKGVDGTALAAAQTEAAAQGLGLLIASPVTIATAVGTISAPVRFEGGGKLVVNAGGSVTLSGPMTAPLTQIFDTSGGGTLTFSARVSQVYPQWWGAKGDGVSDDTAAIQAAIDALDDGSFIHGKLVFPPGVYKVTGPIVIGDGSKFIGIEIEGLAGFGGAAGAPTLVRLQQTDPTATTIAIYHPTSKAHSIVIRGLQIQYAALATGIGIDLFPAGSAQAVGDIIERVQVVNAGIGISLGDAVSISLKDMATLACGIGVKTSGTPNQVSFHNVTTQASRANGVVLTGYNRNFVFDGCVFEATANGGSEVRVEGALVYSQFRGCWWEFPGAAGMIEIAGANSGVSMEGVSFIGNTFDGSSGGGGRSIINNTVTDTAITAQGRNMTFIGNQIVNLNGGKALNVTRGAPTASSHPGYSGITWAGNTEPAAGVTFFGILPPALSSTQFSVFQSRRVTDAEIDGSGAYGKPRYMLETGSGIVHSRTILAEPVVPVSPTSGGSVTPDASSSRYIIYTAGAGVASFTVSAPTTPTAGQALTFTVKNASGGALTTTWAAIFNMAAWTDPANGFSRSISFVYNGTNWIDVGRTAADVPN